MTAKANGELVSDLGRAFRLGDTFHYADVPAMFKQLLADGAWREFQSPAGEVVTHDRFGDFLATPPTRGLGVEVDLVRRVIGSDVEALDLLDQAMQGQVGRPTIVDNVHDNRPDGNRSDAALRRLRKDRPDLHQRVLASELSAHQAMQGQVGRPSIHNIVKDKAPVGNGADAALRRLRKDRPDLHEQVLAGAVSAHGAMVEAGFRPRTVTVRTDRPDSIARTLRRALTDDQLHELVQLLGDN